MSKRWYVQRTLQAVFTVYLVVTMTFALIRLLPGGPMDFMRAQLIQQTDGSIGPQERKRIDSLVEAYTNVQPNKPLWEQYINYMADLATLDLGRSMWFNDPVAEIIADALPWTVFLMSTGILLSFAIGIGLGAALAYLEGTRWDVSMSLLSMLMNSIPYYVAGILLVYVLAYQWGWFPTGGRLPEGVEPGFTLAFLGGLVKHAALPIASVVITGFGGKAVSMRGNSVRVMGEDYVRVARLRGLDPSWITLSYIARNAILPMYTNLLISIGFVFGGAVVLEEIFAYPGVGYYLFRSISARDYPLMMGCFLVITLAVVIAIFFADLTYGKIDPRAGQGDSREAY